MGCFDTPYGQSAQRLSPRRLRRAHLHLRQVQVSRPSLVRLRSQKAVAPTHP